MQKKTPTAPPENKSPPERESRRQLPLFLDLSFPRRRPIYDCSILLQVYFELRSKRLCPKPLAKTDGNDAPRDEQLDMFGRSSR